MNTYIALTKTENPEFEELQNNRYILQVFSLISRDALNIYCKCRLGRITHLIDEYSFRYVWMFHRINTRMKHERHGMQHTRWAGNKWTNCIWRQFRVPLEIKSLEERTQFLLQIGRLWTTTYRITDAIRVVTLQRLHVARPQRVRVWWNMRSNHSQTNIAWSWKSAS